MKNQQSREHPFQERDDRKVILMALMNVGSFRMHRFQ
jgi:hypothetical protein